MKLATINKHIEQARDAFLDEIEALASEVRKKYVVPACRKYKLNFRSGNGGYAFYGEYDGRDVSIGGTETLGVAEDAKRYGWNLERVCDALNAEVDRMSCLGHYVRDVTERS